MSDFTIVKLLDKLNPTIITGGFVPRGAYDNATDYAVGDSVDYLGSSYVMWSNAAAGTLPTDTDYWQVVANGGVSSVNTKSGIVVLDPDDLDDTATTNKFTTAGDISKLAGIEALADVTDTTNVTAAGAVMDSELTSLSGVKTLTVPDNTTISTFGATITDDTDAAAARTTLGLTAGGAGDIWVEKAGDTMTGNLVFSGSQKIIGGTSTTADLTLQTTTGVGATGADMHFLVGNNGATEAMTILNDGNVGIGTSTPIAKFHVTGGSVGKALAIFNQTGDQAILTASASGTTRFIVANDGNVGVGTISPNQKLDVLGNINISNGNSLILQRGTGTNRDISFTASSAYDNIGQMFIYPSSGTNVKSSLSISPKGTGYSGNNKAEISVYNTDAVADTANTEFIGIRAIGTNGYVIGSGRTNTGSNRDISLAAGWMTDGSTNYGQLHLSTSGNVGIGTTAPQATLDIVHTNNAAGGIRLQDNLTNVTTKVGRIKIGHYTNAEEPVTGLLMFSTSTSNEINYGGGSGSENAATTLNFYTGATTTTTTGTIRMQVNSFGNVGIGTTSQFARLHVFGTVDDEQLIVQAHSTQTAPLFQLWNSSAAVLVSFSGLGGAIFNEQGADADFRVEGDTDADLLFADASTDRVGIGLNTPGYKLDVNGDINLPAGSAYRVGGTAGVSGTFTTVDLKTVTVTKGIITSIV